MKKTIVKERIKRYRIESNAGTYYKNSLEEVKSFLESYYNNLNWAFSTCGVNVFVENIETITKIKYGKCVKKYKHKDLFKKCGV